MKELLLSTVYNSYKRQARRATVLANRGRHSTRNKTLPKKRPCRCSLVLNTTPRSLLRRRLMMGSSASLPEGTRRSQMREALLFIGLRNKVKRAHESCCCVGRAFPNPGARPHHVNESYHRKPSRAPVFVRHPFSIVFATARFYEDALCAPFKRR